MFKRLVYVALIPSLTAFFFVSGYQQKQRYSHIDIINASWEGYKDEVESIIKKARKKGEDVVKREVNREDKRSSSTALSAACYMGHKDIVELLINNGADVNAKDKDGSTPLMAAASGTINSNEKIEEAKKDIVKLLIKNGANVNAKGRNESTALIAACAHGYADIAKLLIMAGADVNAKSKSGKTALAIASYHGHADIVALLLNNNADMNIQDEHGDTALMDAIREHKWSIAALLINRGAKLKLENKMGETALSLAKVKYHGHDAIEELIKAKLK